LCISNILLSQQFFLIFTFSFLIFNFPSLCLYLSLNGMLIKIKVIIIKHNFVKCSASYFLLSPLVWHIFKIYWFFLFSLKPCYVSLYNFYFLIFCSFFYIYDIQFVIELKWFTNCWHQWLLCFLLLLLTFMLRAFSSNDAFKICWQFLFRFFMILIYCIWYFIFLLVKYIYILRFWKTAKN
jgi:hypothetical protein